MELSKNSIKLSIILIIITVLILITLKYFSIDLSGNKMLNYDFFSGVLITLLTSIPIELGAYAISKKNIKHKILKEFSEIYKLFDNIIFYYTEKYDYETFKHSNDFSHNTYHRDYKAEYEIYKAEVEDTNEKVSLEIIAKYKQILKYDFSKFENLIDDLSFFTEFFGGKKKNIECNLIDFLTELQDKLRQYENFINDCLENKIVDNYIIIRQIEDIQNKLFLQIPEKIITKNKFYVSISTKYYKFMYMPSDLLDGYLSRITDADKTITEIPIIDRLLTMENLIKNM